MKKICIVSFCNMYLLPYAKTYIDIFTENHCECTLLFWNRDKARTEKDKLGSACRLVTYDKELTKESPRIDKLTGYMGATLFFRKFLSRNKFDGVVFLQTHAAIACKKLLKTQYKGKFIVDVRDYTLENIKSYRRAEAETFSCAYKTVISSPAYQNFLPECVRDCYVIAHNYTPFPEESIELIRKNACITQNNVISISFIGTVRFIEMDKKILNLFSGDPRFKINYFGSGSQILKQYCEDNHITNVEFKGAFHQSETVGLYATTNMINNIYGNHNPFLDYALSNKLYHAAQFHIPILVCPDTYMEQVTSEYHMGFSVNMDDPHTPDKLYNWYTGLDREQLSNGCEELIRRVTKENQAFYAMCREFAFTM